MKITYLYSIFNKIQISKREAYHRTFPYRHHFKNDLLKGYLKCIYLVLLSLILPY